MGWPDGTRQSPRATADPSMEKPPQPFGGAAAPTTLAADAGSQGSLNSHSSHSRQAISVQSAESPPHPPGRAAVPTALATTVGPICCQVAFVTISRMAESQ